MAVLHHALQPAQSHAELHDLLARLATPLRQYVTTQINVNQSQQATLRELNGIWLMLLEHRDTLDRVRYTQTDRALLRDTIRAWLLPSVC